MTAPGGTRDAPERTYGASRRRAWTAIAIVVGALIVIDLLGQVFDRAVGGNEPGGAGGSAYATAPDGLAAFGSLLTHYGYDVHVRRGPITSDPPPPGATAFLIEPDVLTARDAGTLARFAEAGGRLVVGGSRPFYLRNLSEDPPEWQLPGESTWTVFDAALPGLREVEASGAGSWSSTGRGRAVVGTATHALVTREEVGRGEILFVADPSPLENAYLARGDDAAFALALAGDAPRPVVFPEGVHGYGARTGLGAIPWRWKIALVLTGVAALAFVWSRARRFGPPDRTARELPPARAEYVRALSFSLERAGDPARAFGPAQAWARSRIAEGAGLGPDADVGEIGRAAARSFGCPPEEVAALLAPVTEGSGVRALGRAVARVAGRASDGSRT